ncbi:MULTISPECIES: isochorismatase family protein [unclassified Janthinobacterium]|uniref:isochorismatase family protein n=1 Tax=unclassified Janthinobacterium TaxID=2610881 RepID=UPI00161A5C50|nr:MULTISPECIES: isochorismatase family protein [unclassified Janthinobacterium]MBB5366718.1 nicotinamidase-related amidase [Janthinobacterium sp. K2C7]MBB5380804.1 nicotinamidase-related amidase [Janthinobacterium sp. K2Li3]MBB5385100.1 nicotinamidase-related amidase [Janthinobacterium sp. K2E3]
MLMDANQSVLVIVDLQGRLMPAIHDAGTVLAQNLRLARIAQLLEIPVLGTEQNRQGLGPNVEEIAALCQQTLHKTHFGACFDGLQAILPPGRKQIVVTGCEAHVCMLQTAVGLLELGYDVIIAIDAVGSRQAASRDAALQRLDRLGAQLLTVEMLAFEWLRDCKHPRFREVLALIK